VHNHFHGPVTDAANGIENLPFQVRVESVHRVLR
jgi:hypothetical protein